MNATPEPLSPGWQAVEELRSACGYSPEADQPVDVLIAYKDALEDAYGTLVDRASAPEPGVPGKLVVEIDLAGLAVGEDDEPRFLPDVIVDRAARVLAESVPEKWELARAAREASVALIRESLHPVVAEALEAAFQPTNRLGETKGAPVTLREHIVKEASEALRVRDRGRTGGSSSLIEDVIKQEVERALRKELLEAVEEARATVLAAVKDQAATVITETIDRVARR